MKTLSPPITTASKIADWFLDRAERAGLGVTPMKLLKLVYLAQGWYLAHKQAPLFGDPIEAWRYGPVVPSLYERFVQFGRHPISEAVVQPSVDPVTAAILDNVWQIYGFMDAYQLSDLTHKPATPWSRAYVQDKNNLIPPSDIERHFKSLIDAQER